MSSAGAPESGLVHTKYRQYQVVGRLKPTAVRGTRKANIFKMNVFADNEVVAKSGPVFEKKPATVATYGIWMRYDSRTGHHNMYREYRDTCINGAVSKMYQDVAARHRSRFSNVQIVRTAMVPVEKMRKTWNKDYLGKDVSFPLTHRVLRPQKKAFKKSFAAKRPRTCYDY